MSPGQPCWESKVSRLVDDNDHDSKLHGALELVLRRVTGGTAFSLLRNRVTVVVVVRNSEWVAMSLYHPGVQFRYCTRRQRELAMIGSFALKRE